MDMDTAAAYLAGSILYGIGTVFALACAVAVNNILHKYWKPVKIWVPSYMHEPHRFVTHEELDRMPPKIEPVINNKNESKAKPN